VGVFGVFGQISCVCEIGFRGLGGKNFEFFLSSSLVA
jgi:hypothetical protein